MKIRLCPTGRFAYLTYAAALADLAKERRRRTHKQGHPPLRVYECERCSYLHLTSRRRRAR